MIIIFIVGCLRSGTVPHLCAADDKVECARHNGTPQIWKDGPLISLRCCTILVFIVTSSLAVAQERGTEAEQAACTPDVFRLCSALIPNEDQIVACLQSKRGQLSPACANAFAPALHRRRHQG